MSRFPFFWMLVFIACAVMEGVALYFQYALNYGPCVLCVQIRAFVFLVLIGSVIGFFGARFRPMRIIATLAALLGSAGMLERSYQTLGIERGFIEGSCSLDGGFPATFPLHKWLPEVFEPWESCGYTPELFWGITMAEGLIAISILFTIIFVLALPSALSKPKRKFF